jgi:hypothetical protein
MDTPDPLPATPEMPSAVALSLEGGRRGLGRHALMTGALLFTAVIVGSSMAAAEHASRPGALAQSPSKIISQNPVSSIFASYSPHGDPNRQETTDYAAVISTAIAKAWARIDTSRFPQTATARYHAVVLRTGRVTSVTLLVSSGSRPLDTLGTEAIRHAQIPPFPRGVDHEWLGVDVTLGSRKPTGGRISAL